MIRARDSKDLSAVMHIWLTGNCQAHSFIPKDYWERNLPAVEKALPQAEVYVYNDASAKVVGFIGLKDTYIEGIFVNAQSRGAGIGKQLLDFAKAKKQTLALRVYQKNTRAQAFYVREGFYRQSASADEATGEAEWLMRWTRTKEKIV